MRRYEQSRTGKQPHVCKQCDKGFNQPVTLLGHEIIHSGEKPYECILCGRCFRHMKESILDRSLMNAKNVANVLAEQTPLRDMEKSTQSARRIKEYQKILEIGQKIT